MAGDVETWRARAATMMEMLTLFGEDLANDTDSLGDRIQQLGRLELREMAAVPVGNIYGLLVVEAERADEPIESVLRSMALQWQTDSGDVDG